MAANKDYYQILGVGRSSSQEDIKQAYKKLAKEHHPDMVQDKDKSGAEKRFKEINEAYQVLGDPQKRRMYDQFGHAGPGFSGAGPSGGFSGFGQAGQRGPFTYTYTTSGGGSPFEGFGDFDPFDVFEQFFGFRGFGGSARPRKGKNLYYELQISLKEAVFGFERDISIESGRVRIKIPQGARDGTEFRFAGKGMPSPQSAPSGDLFITVRLAKPSGFDIVDSNIVVVKDVSVVDAILGGVVDVPIVDLSVLDGVGTTKLKIPAGMQPGTSFLIRGKGMPKLNARGQGDVLVHINVVIPKKISRKQKELLERFNQENR